jgi:hypothetical protein
LDLFNVKMFQALLEATSVEECEAKRRALIADGEAADDMFIFLGPPKPMNGSPE